MGRSTLFLIAAGVLLAAGCSPSQSPSKDKPLPEDCVASAFANRDLYVVLANYGQSSRQIETAETYVPTDDSSAASAKRWQLPKRSLRILRRSV